MAKYVLLKQEEECIKTEDDCVSDPDEREMLVGESFDSRETRDRWIDSVEKILENESFERGKKHIRRNLRQVRDSSDYGLNQPPKWMVR